MTTNFNYNHLAELVSNVVDQKIVSLRELFVQENAKLRQDLLEKMSQLEQTMNGKMDDLENKLNGKMDNLESTLNNQMNNLDKTLNGRVDNLESTLNNKINSFETQIRGEIANATSKFPNLSGNVWFFTQGANQSWPTSGDWFYFYKQFYIWHASIRYNAGDTTGNESFTVSLPSNEIVVNNHYYQYIDDGNPNRGTPHNPCAELTNWWTTTNPRENMVVMIGLFYANGIIRNGGSPVIHVNTTGHGNLNLTRFAYEFSGYAFRTA